MRSPSPASTRSLASSSHGLTRPWQCRQFGSRRVVRAAPLPRGAPMPYRSIFRPDLFKGQVYIVTGGGSGIGRCIAHELVALGAHAVLIGRRIERLEQVAAELKAEGGTADCHALDIRDEPGVKETVARIVAKHPKIDGL